MATKPTHEQAQLHLQVYELRREARLRQARDWFFKNYIVKTFEDTMRIAAPGTESGALAGMVISYWEQACALLNYGLLHEDLFFETSGEFFGVWERVKPIVPHARQKLTGRGTKQAHRQRDGAATAMRTYQGSVVSCGPAKQFARFAQLHRC